MMIFFRTVLSFQIAKQKKVVTRLLAQIDTK